MNKTALSVTVGAMLLGVTATDGWAQSLRFAGGPQGGAWYPLSGALQGLIESSVPGTSVQVQPGAGVSNVIAISTRQADLGLGNAVTTAEGLAGKEPFPAAQDNVCQLATLYFSYFHVITTTDGNITSMEDIRGRRLTTAARGNTGEALTRSLLLEHGISYDDLASVVYGSFSDSVSQMKDGHVEVFTAFTTVPSGAVMDLASARDIRILHPDPARIEAMTAASPGLNARDIPAGQYPNQADPVPSFGTWTHLMARCDLDEQLAHDITAAVAASLPNLTNVVAAIGGTLPEDLKTDIGVPMHPGAQRFFDAN